MNALAIATGEQGLEFFAFDASYVEKLRAGDAHIEGHFVLQRADPSQATLALGFQGSN